MTFVDDLLALTNRGSAGLYVNPLRPGGSLGGQVPHSPQFKALLDVLAPPDAGGTGMPPTTTYVPGTPVGGPGGQPLPPATPGMTVPAGGTGSGGGQFAPFGQPGTDSPPAWLASAALAAYQAGNTKYRDHLLADPTIAGNQHLRNFITGLFAGDPDRIAEAKHYATNPSYNGWNNAAGDGIPGDGK